MALMETQCGFLLPSKEEEKEKSKGDIGFTEKARMFLYSSASKKHLLGILFLFCFSGECSYSLRVVL